MIIVGLGNPGEKYKNNRHNVGVRCAAALKSKIPEVTLIIPKVFMNESGKAVKEALPDNYSLKDLYIVHDDLDILLGKYKIQFGTGPKGHNGLGSIYHALGTDQFWHVRIGVDNRPAGNRTPGEEYVLQDFREEERILIEKVIKEVVQKIFNF